MSDTFDDNSSLNNHKHEQSAEEEEQHLLQYENNTDLKSPLDESSNLLLNNETQEPSNEYPGNEELSTNNPPEYTAGDSLQKQLLLLSNNNGGEPFTTNDASFHPESNLNNETQPSTSEMPTISEVPETSAKPESTELDNYEKLNTETMNDKSPLRIMADEKKRKKPTTEGSNFQTKINVGYNHQVPFTPAFFLDNSYNNLSSGGKDNTKQEWARLMYSPYQMEKIRRRKLKEGSYDKIIKNEYELAEFIQMCAKNWKNNPGWHPFSPEFAYKILHFADYDPNKALKYMNDPNFNFLCVCDPPVRRYDNKWKPKDRRGQVPTNPYPPPVTLRGYLLRRHNNK